MVNLFERLAQGRPAQESTPPTPASLPIHWAAQKLLDWLQDVWKEPVVRAQDIYRRGPNCIRDKESALKAAEMLVRRGWLIPMKGRHWNSKIWQITTGPPEAKEYRARYSVRQDDTPASCE